jgi:hypothetical protein
MGSMQDIVQSILTYDRLTFWVVVILAVWSASLVKKMSESTGLALIFLPSTYYAALTSIYLCRHFEIVFSTSKVANTILCASLGMMIISVVLLVFAKLVFLASSASVKSKLNNRGMKTVMDA